VKDPVLVPRDALVGLDVALSVSESADLARLGLNDRHAQLAIGELTRAVLIAGGRIVYGGRLRPSGFTQQLMAEVERFGTGRSSLTICLAWPEHRKMTAEELDDVDRRLGTWGTLIALDADGGPIPLRDAGGGHDDDVEASVRAAAYSGMRRFVTKTTQARVLVGGKLSGYLGAMPGIIEEALHAIAANQPVYIAGGFGGAAALLGRHLGLPLDWLPADVPDGQHDRPVSAALAEIDQAAAASGWSLDRDALSPEERAVLATSHRPADIASLSVLGLARTSGQNPAPST
jgi:hypothetical protein